jgi:hypothetical protein
VPSDGVPEPRTQARSRQASQSDAFSDTLHTGLSNGASPRAAHDSVTGSDVAPKDSKANAVGGSSVQSRFGLSGFETYLLSVRVGIAGKHT